MHDKVYNEITDESTCFQIVKGHADCIYNTNARNSSYMLTVNECADLFMAPRGLHPHHNYPESLVQVAGDCLVSCECQCLVQVEGESVC